ncbi:IS66 family transposase, partial [Paenibacillus marchantiophytorum]|uniref:IS66 family transposase n=1 Tax=Paenibacillus marchantiophytorum TaxID=1619310 RepID=UPI00166A3577
EALKPAEQFIRERLLQSNLLHADETSFRVENKKYWAHTVSNAEWTSLSLHLSRGLEAVKANNLLPHYKGRVMHDCLSMYFHDKFTFKHALCGAHLIRECQGIIDNDGHFWATDLKELLQDACKQAKTARSLELPLSPDLIADLECRYDEILAQGAKEWGPPKRSKLKKGITKKTKAASLGDRFIKFKPYILGFLRDAQIPFDNNQAERDLRMLKVKQKISGTMRTEDGAVLFLRIRSVISTLQKQARPIFDSLFRAFRGQFIFN